MKLWVAPDEKCFAGHSEAAISPLRAGFFADRRSAALLTCMVLVYVAFFSITTILTYRGFKMSAYDIGIHDQALWKLSTLRGFFNTVRGMNIWGDHCWLIMAFIAPLYRIVPRLETLLVVQTVALAAGAFPLAAYTFRKTGSRAAALLLAGAFLLSPALQNMNLENAHPEVLALPFLLWMIAAAESKSWRAYWPALLLALLCKEDVALTSFAIGFWIFFQQSRKAGVVTMILSLLYFLLCMKIILPYFNGSGFFRFQGGYWFSTFWAHKFDAAYYGRTLFRPEVGWYAWKLLFPLLGLCLLSPLLCMAALPGFLVNVLSGNVYLIGIDYHYNYQTLPVLFAAAAGGIAVIQSSVRAKQTVTLVSLCLLAASLTASLLWSRAPLSGWGTRLAQQWRYLKESQCQYIFKRLTSFLPADPDIPISASHNLVPSLAHRNEIYQFPNPWQVFYWGISGENQQEPGRVRWLVLDTSAIGVPHLPLLKHLINSGEFCTVAEEGSWLLAQRNGPSGALQYPACAPPAALLPRDWLTDPPPATGVRLRVYHEKTPLTALRPLSRKAPDLEILTKALEIPVTAAELTTVEGSPLKASDNIRILFSGRWNARGEEDIRFRVKADDGCRIYLDGKLLLDYDGVHDFVQTKESVPLRLSPGEHVIVVDYFEWGGRAGLSVSWKSAAGDYRQLRSGDQLP